jgi:inorganic triphosphatase YgiF
VSISDQVERELKLGAWPEFALPDLTGALDGVRPGESTRRELDAIYYDTADLHLLRRGATLRFRRGEPPGDVWTAKLPSDAAAQGLARREMTVDGRREAVPQQFADVTRGWALGRRLRPVARVRTVRVSVPLCDDRGQVLATLDDDSVTVMRGRQVVARFRELEVELVGDAPQELIAALDERLRAAGAEKVPQIPKLSRALGRAAAQPWQLAVPPVGSKPTMAAAAHARMSSLVAELVDLHAPLVLGGGGATSRARRVVGRQRATLGMLERLLDPPPGADIAQALSWLDGELADPAELDSMLDDVQRALAGGVIATPSGQALVSRTEAARDRAHAGLLSALRNRRYVKLLQQLEQLVTRAPVASPAGGRRVASAAARKQVRAAWRPLRDAGAALPGELRPVIGELVVALELASFVPNPDATDALQRVEQLDALAVEHDNAEATAVRLRALARRGGPAEGWSGGVVAGRELARAEAAASRFVELRGQVAQKTAWSWTESLRG